MNYYNEFDPHAAAWLKQLIAEGLIPPGEVDQRSITDVKPNELSGFTQCHFFAGIGGWPLGLQLAGVSSDEPLWTGSCPCQPFSHANRNNGGGIGKADPRHLLPTFLSLIGQCGPPIVLGEQVAAAIGKGWWDDAAGALEGYGYACGAAILPACAFGAEHERKRLFWGSDSRSKGREGHQPIQRVPFSAPASLSIAGDPFTGARRALAGDQRGLLPCDGLSVQLERRALQGWGNAIVPQVAAEFIKAFMSV